ncbi:MAG: CDP-alcohol phosphatidyltransferase family protein [Gemmatimonadaceae bacterium]
MLDELLRPVKERALTPFAILLGDRTHPTAVTVLGFAFGIASAAFAARANYGAALALWAVNRALDGLDGTLARVQGSQTDRGGYLDILLDFIVYAAIPLALVMANRTAPIAVAAAVMLGSFYVNAGSWMYLSAILERRDAGARARGELTSVTMPTGLIGGTETIVLYTLFFLFPRHLTVLFLVTSLLVLATAGQRLLWAVRKL